MVPFRTRTLPSYVFINTFNIILLSVRTYSKLSAFIEVFLPKRCKHIFSHPCVSRVLPISSYILSSYQHLAMTTNHEVPHHAVLSILPLPSLIYVQIFPSAPYSHIHPFYTVLNPTNAQLVNDVLVMHISDRICCYFFFFFLWRCGPTRAMASSFLRFLDHTQRRITVCRTPLDE